MTEARSFEAHLALFTRFADRVAALSPDAWDRLQQNCAALDSESFDALLNRARLWARPYAGFARNLAPESIVFKVVAGISTAWATTVGVANEIASEFSQGRDRKMPLAESWDGVTDAGEEAYVKAFATIENSLAGREKEHPGVATAVRAAGQAVLRRDWLSDEDFNASYGLVESEIPFASLDAEPTPGGEAQQ